MHGPCGEYAQTNLALAGKESRILPLTSTESLLVSMTSKYSLSPTPTEVLLGELVRDAANPRVPAWAVPAARTASVIARATTIIARLFMFWLLIDIFFSFLVGRSSLLVTLRTLWGVPSRPHRPYVPQFVPLCSGREAGHLKHAPEEAIGRGWIG